MTAIHPKFLVLNANLYPPLNSILYHGDVEPTRSLNLTLKITLP